MAKRFFYSDDSLTENSYTISSDDETDVQDSSTALTTESKEAKRRRKAKSYKAGLSFRPKWKETYDWLLCESSDEGMFCSICRTHGRPPSSAKGAWTVRGIRNWNHGAEMLKQHNSSQWHKDAVVASQHAASGRTVFGMQLAGVRKAQEEKRLKNRSIILKLLRSVYFMAKEHVPHPTTFTDLVGLQIENGDDTLKQHVESGAGNAQYTSSFSCTNMIKAIDDWILNGLHSSIRKSSYFSILADESQDITCQEELSVCCRWLVDGKPEEHFLDVIHVKATNAETLAKALTDFIETTGLDFEKLVGQGYDRAATFSGTKTGVGKRIRTRAAHALYVHCSCHRLQLASVQAAASNPEIKKSIRNDVKFVEIVLLLSQKS